MVNISFSLIYAISHTHTVTPKLCYQVMPIGRPTSLRETNFCNNYHLHGQTVFGRKIKINFLNQKNPKQADTLNGQIIFCRICDLHAQTVRPRTNKIGVKNYRDSRPLMNSTN